MAELSQEKNRLAFESELDSLYATRTGKPRWSKERILGIMQILDEYRSAAELNKVRNSTHYHYWRHYEVINDEGQDILIMKRKLLTDPAVKIVPSEEYFEVLTQVHDATGHGGRDKMLSAIKNNCLIPAPVIRAFLNHCDICKIKKANVLKNRISIREVIVRRGLLNLIDKQDKPDRNFKWILVYQDALTRFSFLRPLTTNLASEVALELLKIFLEVGCPHILVHSNSDFTSNVIAELEKLRLKAKIVGNTPKLEFNCGDIEALLDSWLRERETSDWSVGLYFVQYEKNTTDDNILAKTPFKALFGVDARKDTITDEIED